MRPPRATSVLATLVLALAGTAFGEETVRLQPLAAGAMTKLGGYVPQRLVLKNEKPSGLAKAPELAAPLFGVLSFGAGSRPPA